MKEFILPVRLMTKGTIGVEANTLEEALKMFDDKVKELNESVIIEGELIPCYDIDLINKLNKK